MRLLDTMAAADLADPASWQPLLADDIHLRVAARPPALGRPAAQAELGALLAGVRTVGKVYAGVWRRSTGGAMVAELELGYGKGVAGGVVPCAVIARAARGLFVDLRFYLDPTPLFRPAGGP